MMAVIFKVTRCDLIFDGVQVADMSTSIDIGLIQFFLCFVRFENICLNEVHDTHVPIIMLPE